MNNNETRIPRMRTLPKAVEEIRAADPDTQFTLATLRKLVKRGAVNTVALGNYSLVDLDQLIEVLQSGYIASGTTVADFSSYVHIAPIFSA